jgi:hypothetical protein
MGERSPYSVTRPKKKCFTCGSTDNITSYFSVDYCEKHKKEEQKRRKEEKDEKESKKKEEREEIGKLYAMIEEIAGELAMIKKEKVQVGSKSLSDPTFREMVQLILKEYNLQQYDYKNPRTKENFFRLVKDIDTIKDEFSPEGIIKDPRRYEAALLMNRIRRGDRVKYELFFEIIVKQLLKTNS